MARFEVLIASFVLALAFKSIQCSSAVMHSNVTLMVTSDNKFLMGNSSVKFQSLDNVTIPNGPSQYIRVSYISGRRVFGLFWYFETEENNEKWHSFFIGLDDRILAAVSDSKQATQSLCFALHLDFPEYGNSSVPITFIEVIVDQVNEYLGKSFRLLYFKSIWSTISKGIEESLYQMNV